MSSSLIPVPHKVPMLDMNGNLSPVWSDFFQKMYLRMGGNIAYTNDELAADGFTTFARMQTIATDKLIGRDTAATGAPESIGVTGGIEFTGTGSIQTSAFTGDVTKAAGGTATTIANNAVSFIKMLSTDWTKSTSTTGYTKLPNGIVIQWGVTGTLNTGTTNTVSFPLAFPTACLQVVPGVYNNSAAATTTTGQWGTGNYGTSSFDLYNRTSINQVFNWIAVGN